MNDSVLLRKMRQGDPSGLEGLMDRYIPYISTVVWNILRGTMSREDAEEVVSDVFVAAWQQADKLRSGAVKAWLGAVARNMAKNKLCAAGGTLPLEEDMLELPDRQTPEGAVQWSEDIKLVRKAVDSLRQPDREIFLRHYYYAQTVAEISMQMQLNESTVKTKLRRGRQRLKELLMRWDAV